MKHGGNENNDYHEGQYFGNTDKINVALTKSKVNGVTDKHGNVKGESNYGDRKYEGKNKEGYVSLEVF